MLTVSKSSIIGVFGLFCDHTSICLERRDL